MMESTPPASPASTPSLSPEEELNLPSRIVGIGASAGGLEALELFFSHMPSDSGLAFVVVQHLSPDFKSVMDELLARRTRMRVVMAENGMPVLADTIYLLPRKTEMTIREGALRLAQRDPHGNTLLLPIDAFFESLADDAAERAVGVVLSGTGSDGSRGIRAIHQAGGLVLAQSEESAKFDGMPRAAADTEIVDFILPPERMPEILLAYAGATEGGVAPGLVRLEESEFSAVFHLLKAHHGIDFHSYKPTTMRRRIERRIILRDVGDLEAYVKLLKEDGEELEALYVDLLIGVTRFFRDEAAFERLRDEVLPKLFADKSSGEEVRAWVCGCATGEEAYSIAILLLEAAKQEGGDYRIKVFATDVHRRTLDRAARGIYTHADLTHVPERLRERYFNCEGETCRVKPDLRQAVVFSEHNLTADPPFTKIDLVSCRNLLIYLQSSAQRKAISLFHFSLNVGGFLMLGPSESLGALEDEFTLVDRHWKIYSKRRDVRVFSSVRELSPAISAERMVLPLPGSTRLGVDGRLARAYDALLARYIPASVLVDDARRLLHSFGEVSRFFVRPEGRPTLDLVEMLAGDLRVAVAAALQRSIKEGRKVTYQGVIHEAAAGTVRLNLGIEPLADRIGGSNLYHILFEEVAMRPRQPASTPEVVEEFPSAEGATLQRIRDLEIELQYSKEHLQTTVEELETSNEELQATNEELLASNEELQSTNEELHSVNEELYTVNAEYEKKNRELVELNTDIDNLLQSTDIGTLFLDEKLLVRKFTPSIRIAFNLLPQDVGRSIADITCRVEGNPTLWQDATDVLEEGRPLDRRVRSVDGRDLLLRLRPYRVSNLESAGVVLTFVDISELTQAQRRLAESEERFRKVANSTPSLLWMIDAEFGGIYFNAHWTHFSGRPLPQLEGAGWKSCLPAEDWQTFEALCADLPQRTEPAVAEVRMIDASGQTRWVRVSGAARMLAGGELLGFIFTAVDINDMRNAADVLRRQVAERTAELQASEEFFQLVGEVATDGYWDWDLTEDRIHLSPSFKALFGYADNELENTVEGWWSVYHPEDRAAIETAFRRHWEEERPCELVVRCFHRDGSPRWVILRGAALRNRDGACYRMIGTHTDITAQKEAETRIRKSETRFRGVFDTGLMGIGVVDKDLLLIEANERLLAFIGLERHQLPIALRDLSTPQGFAISETLVAEARLHGVSGIQEKDYFHVDGSATTVRLGYSQLDGATGDLVVIAEDITAERESKRALRESEARLAQAIEATNVRLLEWVDPLEAGVLRGSPELFRMLGLEAGGGEAAEMSFLNRLHADDRNRLRAAIDSGVEPLNLDLRLLGRTGETRWIYLRAKRLPHSEERPGIRLVGSAQDVTERYASQASLQLKTELLEKSNQDLEQFAYIASHDLKEPLRTVTGFLQILKGRYRSELGAEGAEFVLRAIDASNRMHALIDGLLEFSRIGRADLQMKKLSLHEAAEIARNQLQAAIAETGAILEMDDLPMIRGDLTLIARVFLNLFSNAIKFNSASSPLIHVHARRYDNHVRVFVRDNGIGIDPKFADRIFVIFQRLHTREEYPGTGIGLSVCRKIMERHEGCIWLETGAEGAEGAGTTIGLAFPLVVES
jgi:two-component system, chemotaxis family, CheB/CheR fusion protein